METLRCGSGTKCFFAVRKNNMILLHVLIFLISCLILALSSKWLVDALIRIALFLQLKEFVVAFFLMAFATSLPNLFVGVISALNKIPELSFGDVVGGNIFDLSILVGLTALISRDGLLAESRTVQGSSIFTISIAVLPLFLIFDGSLSRGDGVLLIFSFFCYIFWLFSKKDRFSKTYDHFHEALDSKRFLKDILIMTGGIILLMLGGEGVVKSASFFSQTFGLSLGLIGVLIVGVGNCLPETFFTIQAARKGQDWMILGNLMGSVVIVATLVLGIVALICPIEISDFSPFAVARFFLIISAVFFLFFVRTNRKITKKEALFLIGLYILFVLAEIFTK